jgi:AcrR family transcriptional regulator
MKRDELLDAAEALLCEHGTHGLTLSAVADRAGVSKGGLLYHFPNKEALIKGLVTRLIEEFDALVASYEDGRTGSFSRAYVEATFAVVTDRDERRHLRRWAVVSAAATDPELVAPLRAAMDRWHRRDPGEDRDPVAAQIARLAVEGLWEVVIHDPGLCDEAQYEALRTRLLALVAP